MVAPAEKNEPERRGTFGDPITRSTGSTWTQREFQAIKARARFGSTAKVIRSLIDHDMLRKLIADTEAEKKKAAGN